jgi:3-deoxy-manno-octulosonate cytidylyltransferase (CMP-KDO synthetase)
MMPRIIGIIPARYASTRFPGKPLAKIKGKTLIQRTYENASQCDTLEKLIIATDDKRIYDHALDFGAEVVMTSEDCPTGTDRLAEVIRNDPSLDSVQIIINIQGDEPCLDPSIISQVAKSLEQNSDASMSTGITPLKEEDAFNSSVTKCVIDQNNYALYFSRSLIPAGKQQKFNPNIAYYKHLGVYGYRRDFLLLYSQLKSTPLQMAEDLEQLKVLEHGYKIITTVIHGECFDVNVPEDIQKVEKLLCK